MKKESYSKEEYMDLVQMEFFGFLLRSKIYDEPYAKWASDVAEKKLQKLKMLKRENKRVKCIIDSDEEYNRILKEKFLNKLGLPNFRYKPDQEKYQRYHDARAIFKNFPYVEKDLHKYKVVDHKGECVVISRPGETREVLIKDVKINLYEFLCK